jgi:hypothetical protein
MEKIAMEKAIQVNENSVNADIDITTPQKHTSDPIRVATHAIGIALIAISLTLILRGYIAYSEGVFFETQLRQKIPTEAQKQLNTFEELKKSREAEIKGIDILLSDLLKDPSKADKVPGLLDARNQLITEVRSMDSPIKLQPFYLSDTMLLWTWLYMCLGWIIFLMKPKNVTVKQSFSALQKTLTITAMLFIAYRWPTWLRNFALGNEAQRVFAAANYSVSPVYFYTQEVIVFGLCFLIALIWRQWTLFYLSRDVELKSEAAREDILEQAFSPVLVNRLSETFIRWQAVSVVLALAFLLYTNVFWQYVVKYKDQRYIVSAVIIHLLWGATWLIISLPLLRTWYSWYITRTKALALIPTRASTENSVADVEIKALTEINPIPLWNIAGSSLTAIIAFLLPLLNPLKP